MTSRQIAGIVLMVLGFAALIGGTIPYKKTENVAHIGDLKMEMTEQKEFTIPPLVGGIAILAGAALFFTGKRKTEG